MKKRKAVIEIRQDIQQRITRAKKIEYVSETKNWIIESN